jgi:hypothetical protein
MGIVRAANFVNGCLLLDESLIFPVQIKPRLDGDRAMAVEAALIDR